VATAVAKHNDQDESRLPRSGMVFGDAISAEARQKGLAIDFFLALKKKLKGQHRCKMVTASARGAFNPF